MGRWTVLERYVVDEYSGRVWRLLKLRCTNAWNVCDGCLTTIFWPDLIHVPRIRQNGSSIGA